MTTTYDPHAILATWLDGGWEANEHDCEHATLAFAAVGGNCLHLGTWRQALPVLVDFDSPEDGYFFAVAALGIDPLARIPDGLKQWTKRPQPEPDDTPVQAKMF